MMRILIILVALFGSAIANAQAPQTPAAPAGNAKNGQTLFQKTGCFQCHGGEGQGTVAGPRLGPAPMLAFRAFVTYARAPRAEMPPYSTKVMSEQDLADIYAFLAARPRPPALNTIPLLVP